MKYKPYLLFKLKKEMFKKGKKVFKKKNVSVFMCRNAPSAQVEENPTQVGDSD